MVHSARPPRICQSSWTKSGRSGARAPVVSGERKENLLQARSWRARARTQLGKRSDPPQAPIGERGEAIADPLGGGQLWDRQMERAPAFRLVPKRVPGVAGLPEIAAVDRSSHATQRMRRQKSQRECQASCISFGQGLHALAQAALETEPGNHLGRMGGGSAVDRGKERQRAGHRLFSIRANAVGYIEDGVT